MRKHLGGKNIKKAKKSLKMLASGLKERMAWLAVADVHGHQPATRYAEDDELSSIVSSSSKKKRLRNTIEATKSALSVARKPFRQNTPTAAGQWSASREPARAPLPTPPPPPARPVTRQSSASCHHCGEPGHFIRFCPKVLTKS